MRTSTRPGFTLIELLMVVVIIGVLAAVAVPRFGKARDRAYFKAIMSDLRNLQAQQEVYFAMPGNYTYASAVADIDDFRNSSGVVVYLSGAGSTGWAATAAHGGLETTRFCAIYAGTVSAVPSPATTQGVVACTGE